MSLKLREGDRNRLISESRKFLTRYGYMKPCSHQSSLLCDCCCKGIERLQHVCQLQETGHLDLSTLKVMNRARCGNPDFSPTIGPMARVVSGYRWTKPVLTWSMLGYTRDILGKKEVREFRNALKVWEVALEGKLQFVHFLTAKLRKAVEADIVALFGLTNHKAPDPQKQSCPYDFEGELAHAFYPILSPGFEYLAGNCHFDDIWSWIPEGQQSGAYSFRGVSIHELGHVLGLPHDMEHKDSIMYPWFLGLEELSDWDINAIREAYK